MTIALWRSPYLLPLKVLVVFLHEIGHALGAIMTGGTVEEIRVFSDQSGLTLARGGNFIVIASAGYVGSSVIGALLLRASAAHRWAAVGTGLIGAVVLVMTVLYVPFSNAFGFAFGIGAGSLLLLLVFYRPRALLLVVMALAVMCCLYSVYDFADYLLGDPHLTDAGILAKYLGASFLAYPIGIAWSALSLWIMAQGLAAACTVAPASPPQSQGRSAVRFPSGA